MQEGINMGASSSSFFGVRLVPKQSIKNIISEIPRVITSMSSAIKTKSFREINSFEDILKKEAKKLTPTILAQDPIVVNDLNEIIDSFSSKNKIVWEYGRKDHFKPYNDLCNDPPLDLACKLDILYEHSHPNFINSELEKLNDGSGSRSYEKLVQESEDPITQHNRAIDLLLRINHYLATVDQEEKMAVNNVLDSLNNCHNERHNARSKVKDIIDNENLDTSEITDKEREILRELADMEIYKTKHLERIVVKCFSNSEELKKTLKEKSPLFYSWVQKSSHNEEEASVKQFMLERLTENPYLLAEFTTIATLGIITDQLLGYSFLSFFLSLLQGESVAQKTGAEIAQKAFQSAFKNSLSGLPSKEAEKIRTELSSLVSNPDQNLSAVELEQSKISGENIELLLNIYNPERHKLKESCSSSSYVSHDLSTEDNIYSVPVISNPEKLNKKNNKGLVEFLKQDKLALPNGDNHVEQAQDVLGQIGDVFETFPREGVGKKLTGEKTTENPDSNIYPHSRASSGIVSFHGISSTVRTPEVVEQPQDLLGQIGDPYDNNFDN